MIKYEFDKNRKEYQYALKIVNGTYKACNLEKLACQRFIDDLEKQNDPSFMYCYDTTRADRFFDFMGKCADVDAPPGTMLKLAEFQYFDYGNIYGWVRKDTGVRRFTEALIFQSRGQGKSTMSAGQSLYGLTADALYPPYHPEKRIYELNPYIVTLAVDKAQTKQVRGTAMQMALHSPEILEQVDVKTTYIKGKRRGGDITAVSKETGNLDGAKLNLVICDEWAAQKEDTRVNVLRGSFGKRQQCLLMKITTASDDAMLKPAKYDYDRCCEILRGHIVDDNYFIVIRQLDECDDPADFSLYEKAAPMLREKTDYARRLLNAIKQEYSKAFEGGTSSQRTEYLIKRTNRWQVVSEEKFLKQEALDILKESMVPAEEFMSMIQGQACVNGIDASKVIDLTAQAYIFNLPEGKTGIFVHGFMPEESLYRHKKSDRIPYDTYAQQGYMTLIDGSYIDNNDMKEFMCKFERDNDLDIKAVCADRAYCYQYLIDLEAGRTPNGKSYEVIEVPQTTTYLNEPCLDFEKLLMARKLVVCENPIFLQHCANAYVESDKGGRIKIAKKNPNSPYRIDLLAAVINAFRKKDLLADQSIINAIANGTFSFFD